MWGSIRHSTNQKDPKGKVMNVVVKSDVIWIRPIPKRNVVDGIQLYIPKLESETNKGITMHDIVKGQGDYQLPDGITADDISDIKVKDGVLMIDFK